VDHCSGARADCKPADGHGGGACCPWPTPSYQVAAGLSRSRRPAPRRRTRCPAPGRFRRRIPTRLRKRSGARQSTQHWATPTVPSRYCPASAAQQQLASASARSGPGEATSAPPREMLTICTSEAGRKSPRARRPHLGRNPARCAGRSWRRASHPDCPDRRSHHRCWRLPGHRDALPRRRIARAVHANRRRGFLAFSRRGSRSLDLPRRWAAGTRTDASARRAFPRSLPGPRKPLAVGGADHDAGRIRM